MSRDIFLGMMSGLGEAYHQQNVRRSEEEASRRKAAAEYWRKHAEDPSNRPEAQEVAMRKYMTYLQTPLEKKIPKDVEGLDDFLKINVTAPPVPQPPSPAASLSPAPFAFPAEPPIPPPSGSLPPQYTMDEQNQMLQATEASKGRGQAAGKVAFAQQGMDYLDQLRQQGKSEEEISQAAQIFGIEPPKAPPSSTPQFVHFGTAKGGIIYGKTENGVFTQQGEIPGAADIVDLDHREVRRGEEIYIQYFPKDHPDQVTYETLKGKARDFGTPGAKSAVVGPNGNIIGVLDSETGMISKPTFAPGAEDLEGEARRNALPQGAQDKLAAFNASDAILDDIESYSKKIHTSEGLSARGGGLVRRGLAYAGYDADITSLKSKAGEMAQIVRSLGEVGALSEGDVARGTSLLPIKPELTKTESSNMIRDLRALIKKGRDNYRKQLGLDRSGVDGPTAPPRSGGLSVDYQGKRYTFPTEDGLNNFKRDLGIR